MHWLAVGLWSLINGVTVYFAQYFTKRVAVGAAMLTVWVAFVVTFTAAISNAMQAVGSLVPPGIVSGFYGLIPGNLPVCLALLLTAHLAAVVYRWHGYLLQMFSLKAGV